MIVQSITTAVLMAFAAKIGDELAGDVYELVKDCFSNPLGISPLKSYYIVSAHSKKCLDVAGASTEDGASIIQWTYLEGNNQKWHLIPVDKHWIILARHSRKCLDVAGFQTNNGASLIQWAIRRGDNQLWELIDTGGGYYQIKAKHSGKCLAVSGKQLNNGAEIIQWEYRDGQNQRWKLIPTSD